MTSYGRKKDLDGEMKNQENANNSLSYRFAAINKQKSCVKKSLDNRSHQKCTKITNKSTAKNF